MKRAVPLAAGAVVLVGIGLSILGSRMGPILRDRIQQELKERYQSDIQIQDLTISLFPRARVSGTNVVFREHGRTDVPPLVTMKRFEATAGFLGLIGKPTRVRVVRLEGLEIHVPPHRDHKEGGEKARPSPFVLEEVIADGTHLIIIPKTPRKEPKEFHISKLTLHSTGPNRAMTFRATLTNPKPPGSIESTGHFGPWNQDEAGDTPVSGKYTFRHADLSVFKGISGILSSDGSYKGALSRIEVDGHSETPDFRLKEAGNPVDLKTEFHAIVDGTDGDTYLQPVNAHFLHTEIVARGAVEGKPGVKGKTVSLDVDVQKARLEDLLLLSVSGSTPPMSGDTSFQAKLIIPPGPVPVINKMELSGGFQINKARFTNSSAQGKVDTLSRRTQGITEEGIGDEVWSDLKGRFLMKNATASFSQLNFSVPGASISLTGSYGLDKDTLDFQGTAKTEAKVSEMTTGVKSFFLKALDPFFHKDGHGAVIPIRISGTRSDPKFGLSLKGKK